MPAGSIHSALRRAIVATAALLIVANAPADAFPNSNPRRHPADGGALLKKYCAECHSGQLKFDAADVENMRSSGVLVQGNAAKSAIWARLNATKGQMPPKGSPQPTAAEKEAIRAWIEPKDSDPEPAETKPAQPKARKNVKETDILAAILTDLQAANERDLPFLRYFSLANLYRNPSVKDDDLQRYRLALDKLLNSLSWNPVMVRSKAIGPEGLVLRLDVRTLRWEKDAWSKVVALYPYGYRPKDGAKTAEQIRTLSGATVPVLRVDWFVANASRPPLYHDLLQLPHTDRELEAKLGVDADRDMEQESDIHRGGMTNSNVSNNNRIVQRHTSNYGAYWKSFDFKD
ncbi:MAG: c-type cytochrome, partial [Armatimonadaceae bacterium]